MNPAICEREDQTSVAVRSGMIDSETASHAQHCPACSEILLVGEYLREDAALADQERTRLPDVGLIWKQAQLQSNREAIRLALRPIRFMKILAIVSFLAIPWLRFLLPTGRELFSSWMRNLKPDPIFTPRLWPTNAYQAEILLGFAAATVLLTLSSWYMVRQE
jgi:hypothetical protein